MSKSQKDLFLLNSLTCQKEKFVPLQKKEIGLYTCGPTVYDFAHLGNFRTFIFEDILKRVLKYNGYQVNHVMNITDVGHLTGDNLGNADLGEDRLEKGAHREGKTIYEIAKFYTEAFIKDLKALNIQLPSIMPKATDYINEQVELIRKLEKNGLIYQTQEGVYFDTAAYQTQGFDYTILAPQGLKEKKVGAREKVGVDPQKKNPWDFALWLFTVGRFASHLMKWDSPWGVGFPGWHLECSAMSRKFLGQPFDIHTGGIDHIPIHHTNEIVQSQGAYGVPLAKYWLHGEFMMVDGKRMGKSEGNAFLVRDLIDRGFDPLAFRYLTLQTHYRSSMNFTWESLEAAQRALERLRQFVKIQKGAKRDSSGMAKFKMSKLRLQISSAEGGTMLKEEFSQAINDDLNMPRALAVTWKLVEKTNSLPTLSQFDKVLGLELFRDLDHQEEVPREIQQVFLQRNQLRKIGKFKESDKLREEIERKGYLIEDEGSKSRIKRLFPPLVY